MADKRQPIAVAVQTAMKQYNQNFGTSWDWGSNWSSVASGFETFIVKYLFPKITETLVIDKDLGNRFNWLAKEVDYVGQLSEEYTYKDIIPVGLNLSKNADILLRRNYPQILTKLYGQGEVKKNKITMNNNDMRLNFSTLADGIKFVLSATKNLISGFNVSEESEIKAMLVDYSVNKLANTQHVRRPVTSMQDLATTCFEVIQNVQNNSDKYNEAMTASGGGLGRYTTHTSLDKILIITTDKIKTYMLDTKIANTFNNEGLDLTNRVMSFDDLGGAWRLDADFTIDNTALNTLRAFGDYQSNIGDIIEEGTVFTFDVSAIGMSATEIKPTNDLYAFVMDIRSIRYNRYTKDMVKEPFYNGDFDETTHFFHYYSQKAISPFYNKVLISG